MFPSTKDHVQVPYQFSRRSTARYVPFTQPPMAGSATRQPRSHAVQQGVIPRPRTSPLSSKLIPKPPKKKNVGKCLKLPSPQSVCQSCMDSVHRPCVYARFTRVVVFGYAGLHECHFSRKVARATLACAARFVCGECFREPLLFQACRDEK